MKRTICALLAAVLMLSLTACESKAERWQEQYDYGVRYLEDGDYAEAIIAFTAAIEIDPKRADAYAGRGDAYLGDGLFDEAVADYQAAIERDPLPGYYLRLADGYLALGDLDGAIAALEEGYDRTEDPSLRSRISELEHVSRFEGAVYAWGEDYLDSPIGQAVVTLRDMDTGAVVLSYRTDRDGLYSGYVVEGEYEFFAHADGYRSASVFQEVEAEETVYVENLYLLSDEESGRGEITGTVYSAVTGLPLSGAQVWAVSNWNRQDSGQEVETVYTDDEGRYTIPDKRIGYYTVFAAQDGYVTASVNGVASGEYGGNWDIMLSPRLEPGQSMRIVLSWGSWPEDLDSHLIMDYDDWETGMWTEDDTYFNTMETYDWDGNLVSQLDVDDTDSYGPETITIYNREGHEFLYVVHDYTNWGTYGSNGLAMSEASVTVYGENGVLATFHVPANGTGTVWEVFSIDSSGVIHGIGSIEEQDSY